MGPPHTVNPLISPPEQASLPISPLKFQFVCNKYPLEEAPLVNFLAKYEKNSQKRIFCVNFGLFMTS